jgi:hypothetical protein
VLFLSDKPMWKAQRYLSHWQHKKNVQDVQPTVEIRP